MPDPQLRVRITADASDARREMEGFRGSFTELASAVGLVRQGWEMASEAMESLFGPVLAYADTVRQLSTWTGDTAENTSLLVTAAGNLGISAGTLETALRTMSNNGLSPTLDGVRELATQFQRLPTSDRPAWLIENFGRAASEMGLLLEGGPEALDALATSLEGTNLMLDEVDLDRLRNLTVAMGAWGEAILSLKMSIVDSGVLGTLTDLVYGFASAVGALQSVVSGGNIADALRGIFVQGLERSLTPAATTTTTRTIAAPTLAPGQGRNVKRQGGGPLGPITEVGEEGTEGVINGVVVPHREWELLKGLGIVPDQHARYGTGEQGGGGYVKPLAPKGGSKKGATSGGGYITGGGSSTTSGEVATVGDVQAAAQETAAAVPAAAAAAVAAQGEAQAAAIAASSAVQTGVMRAMLEEVKKLNRTLPTYIRDAVERTL